MDSPSKDIEIKDNTLPNPTIPTLTSEQLRLSDDFADYQVGDDGGGGGGDGKVLSSTDVEKGQATVSAIGAPEVNNPPAKSKKRLYPRSKPVEESYQWLLTLGITDDKGKINEDGLSVLAQQYPRDQLEHAYQILDYREKVQEKKCKSKIAVFTSLLKLESGRNERISQNIQYAKEFSRRNPSITIEFKPEHLEDGYSSCWDLSFDVNPEDFSKKLKAKFRKE